MPIAWRRRFLVLSILLLGFVALGLLGIVQESNLAHASVIARKTGAASRESHVRIGSANVHHNKPSSFLQPASAFPRCIQVDPFSLEPMERLGKRTTTAVSSAFQPDIVARELPSRSTYDGHKVQSEAQETKCPYIVDWQQNRTAPPTCNSVHEASMSNVRNLVYLGSGQYKTAWMFVQGNKTHYRPGKAVLKTQNYYRSFFESDLAYHRKDAIIMEQTSSSPYVLGMYSYCHYSSLVQRAPYTLETWTKYHRDEASPLQLLELATAIAIAIRDMQNFVYLPEEDLYVPTFAHLDIKPSQFLMASPRNHPPRVLLNDFNRGRMLTARERKICPWVWNTKHHGNRFRSPEELLQDGEQTDKVDVYSFGSLIYWLITGKAPFEGTKYSQAMLKIVRGADLDYPSSFWKQQEHLAIRTILVDTIAQCRQTDPTQRPSAKKVADELEAHLARISKTSE